MSEVYMLAVGLSITVLFLFIGHWFPWPHPLRRMQAYSYGVGSIIVGFAIWRLPLGDWLTPLGLLVISLAAGAATWFGYAVDDTVVKLHKADKADAVLYDECSD